MQCHTLVIGGGIVGLAVAARLSRHGATVLVERHGTLLHETSGRNSGVVHAGIYYPDETLKTALCLAGATRIWDLHREGRVTAHHCGKWIVATDDAEVPALDAIHRRMMSRGIPSREVPLAEVATTEPLLRAVKVIESPRTGIVDAASLAAAYTADLEANDGLVALQTQVLGAEHLAGGTVRVHLDDGDSKTHIDAAAVVNCAGLSAHRVAALLQHDTVLQRVPPLHLWGGRYASCVGKAPVRRLVYPVPLPSLQGLGSHATIDLGGAVRFGPDAFYIGRASASADGPATVDPEECSYDIAATPGGESGFLDEMHEGVRRFLPSLPRERLVAGYMGIRPKLSGPTDGFKDFAIEREGNVVHCFGIESPGLTSSAGIADHVASLLF